MALEFTCFCLSLYWAKFLMEHGLFPSLRSSVLRRPQAGPVDDSVRRSGPRMNEQRRQESGFPSAPGLHRPIWEPLDSEEGFRLLQQVTRAREEVMDPDLEYSSQPR